MMEIILVDFDGTIAWPGLPWCVHSWLSSHPRYFLSLMYLLSPLYLMRPVVRSTVRQLRYYQEQNWQIVVMSATEDNWTYRLLITLWLKIHRQIYLIHEIRLRPRGVAPLDFKLSLVRQYGAACIIDDKIQVVNFLTKMLGEKITVHVRNGRFEMTIYRRWCALK